MNILLVFKMTLSLALIVRLALKTMVGKTFIYTLLKTVIISIHAKYLMVGSNDGEGEPTLVLYIEFDITQM